MGRQAGETEWAGTTNQAQFSPIGAGSQDQALSYMIVVAIAKRSLKHLYNAEVKAPSHSLPRGAGSSPARDKGLPSLLRESRYPH